MFIFIFAGLVRPWARLCQGWCGDVWSACDSWCTSWCQVSVRTLRINLLFLPHSTVISSLWPWLPAIWEWFPIFLWSYHRKNHCGRNRIDLDHGHPCGTEFTLVSLYSTEITCYRSWFLEYNLTRVNSHRRPCWILYILNWFSVIPWHYHIHLYHWNGTGCWNPHAKQGPVYSTQSIS